MKIYYLLLLSISLFTTEQVYSQQLSDPETRGVWVTGNYFDDAGEIESLVKTLHDNNFNTIFADVWYQGTTIYQSSIVSNAGGPEQNFVFSGTDPLRAIIDEAHKYNMEVFAWFEYGFSVGYSYSESDQPQIIKNHPDWSMVSRDGKITEPDSYSGHFFWIDPAVSAAADFMVDLYVECTEKYPDLDGIELDRMRYPYTTYSYSDTARSRFMIESGMPDPVTLSDDNTTWAEWRRQQVTDVVKRIYEEVKIVNPQCIVTAAVAPPYMMYGQSDDKLQAWDVWAKSCYVDILEPMLYLTVSDYPNQMRLCKNYVPDGFQLAPGIAISSAGTVDNTISEIKTTRKAGFAGEVIWYYGDLLSYTDALTAINLSLYTSGVTPTHNDLIIDNASKGIFKTTGTWNIISGGYKGSYKQIEAAEGDTATFSARILREGNYSLYGYWSGDSINNCSSAVVAVSNGTFTKTKIINQQSNLEQWNLLNDFTVSKGDTVSIKLSGVGGNLIADAFRLIRGSEITSVEPTIVPEEFIIYQNYPNPFNPVTTISLRIPERGNVSLKIYNMLGEEISQLVNEEKEAGNYNITWNSNGFSSGVYFYNAIYNNKSQMKKMILLK